MNFFLSVMDRRDSLVNTSWRLTIEAKISCSDLSDTVQTLVHAVTIFGAEIVTVFGAFGAFDAVVIFNAFRLGAGAVAHPPNVVPNPIRRKEGEGSCPLKRMGYLRNTGRKVDPFARGAASFLRARNPYEISTLEGLK